MKGVERPIGKGTACVQNTNGASSEEPLGCRRHPAELVLEVQVEGGTKQ